MQVIMFGAGTTGRILYSEIASKDEVIAFADNNHERWGELLFDIPICNPEECLVNMTYDAVIISAFGGFDEIHQQCLKLGIPEEKIITSHIGVSLAARKVFLGNLPFLLNEYEQEADVAEAGVYCGDYAKWINAFFPKRILHLFDTFEGFDERDVAVETKNTFSDEKAGHLNESSVEIVMKKMQHPEQCRIHKGYFPDTAIGIESKFCFVNLDMDLYLPTYNGLCFFRDKMTEQGVILVHDYYSAGYKGVKAAVEEFLKEYGEGVNKYPIGDGVSIMLAGKWN